jgi:cytochrome bd-type quinol oxidase subunit 2
MLVGFVDNKFFGASSDTKALVYFILILFLLSIRLVLSNPAILLLIPRFRFVGLSFLKRLITLFCIIFIFAETLYPYVQSGNFNDDKMPLSFFHGDYKIIESTTNPKNIAFIFCPPKRVSHFSKYL